MATKRLSSVERRKQILGCAIRVFARHSFHGATTRMISEEAGIAEALIYRYFGSKRKLFSAAVDHTGGRLVQGLVTILDENPDEPLAALAGLVRFYVDLLERHEELAKMIFLVSAELDDPEVREVYLPYQEQALGLLEGAIARWQDVGFVRKDIAPRAGAWVLLGSYQLLALMKHSGRLDELNLEVALALVRPFAAVQLTEGQADSFS
jgi:AcrR family transcriptional regulator